MLLAERPRPEFTLEPNIGEDPFSGCAGVRGRIDHRFLAASTFSPCNLRRNSADFIETTHFLRSCFLCMGRLHPRGVIYMYRGDRAFCSEKCRKEQMIQDECSFASKKEAPLAASEGCSAKGVTVALKGRGSRESMLKSHISYLLDEVCEEVPCVNSDFASCKKPDCKENEDNGKAVKYCTGNCKQSPNPSSTLESSSPDEFKELGMEPENKGIISDFLSFVGKKESYKSKGKSWTRFYFLYDPRGTEKWRSLIATMANYLEFNIHNLDLTSLSSLSDLTNKLASIMNRSLILIQDFDHCAGMLSDLNATELTGPCLLEFVNGLLLSCGDERIIVFTTNNRDLHAAALHAASLRHPFIEDIYIHKPSPPPVALPDEGEIVQLDSSKQNETEAAASSFKSAFQLEGLTTQSTAYPNPNILVFPQLEIASTEVLSENMGSSEDRGNLLASQKESFLEGHVSESSNLTFPAYSDAAAPCQLVATILHTSPAIPHMIPNLTGGSSETFQLGGQSTQSTTYPNHNSLVFPQPQTALTQIRSENMGSSEDWRASQQEPTCSGPSPSQPPMPTTPYTMNRIPHVMPPLTSSQDASSVKLKATYRDTIIEFQLPVASGIIELREEVAMILKLELDSFDVKYKDEEGDWILIPCDKDFRNYLQLLSSLVNPVIRLLVVDKDANLTNLDPMALKQPAMFMESGIDPDNNGIISDLLRFVSKKEIYKKAGKAWMRFYLLFEPPGADRSSLIAAMANYLEFDIFHLDLRSMSSIPELKNMLLSTPNRSLIAVQDIDHCAEMLPNLKNELTVSCLLKYIDGLFSRCGDERIIVFTTNHRDRHDASLLPIVNMDIYIPASSPQPVALPDGGDIVQLESSEKKPLMDFDPANNKEYHSGVLVSSSKNNNMREASKRRCMKKIVLSLVDPMIGISLADFDAPNNGAHLVGACQSGPIMSNSEKKDTGERLNGDFLTKSVLGLDDSTKRNSLPDFDAIESKARLLIAYQSGPVVSRLENKNSGEALKRECITKSILGLEDLQQHFGGRRDDAVKSFATIYDPGIHMTDSFARKSFEVQETLRPWEQPRNAISTDQEREIWTQMCLEQSDARGAHSVHVNTYARQFRAHLFPSWCHSVCIRCIFGEPPDDFVPLLSLRRLTLKCCVRKEKSPYLPRLLQINAVEPRLTKSPRYSGGSFAKSASCGPISLQDGTHIVMLDPLEQPTKIVAHAAKADQCSLTASLPEKKMARRTLKRKYGFISVIFENHQQHFRRRFEGAVKSFHATHICRKHGINWVSRVKRIYMQHGIQQWPFRQKWETRKGYSLGCERPFEVSSLSMDDRPHLVKQHQSSSTASHCERKNTRETSDKDGITMSSCSVEDHQKNFGCKRKDADEQLSFDATNNKAHHVKADQSGPTLSNSEKENTRVAVKGECGTKGRGGFHTPDSLGPKSFKVLVTLPLRQLSSGVRHLVSRYSRRRLTFKCCVQLNKSWDLPRTLQMNCSEGLTGQKWATRKGYSAGDKKSFEVSSLSMSPCSEADESGPAVSNSEKGSMREALKRDSLKDLRQHFGARRKDAAKGLCDSLAWKSFEGLDILLLGEHSKSIRNLDRRRALTQKHCVQLKKSQDLPRRLLSDCSGELAAQFATGLLDGEHIPSLSEKKIARNTLKRKSRTMSVPSFLDHQQHVGRRWEDDVNILGAKRICRQLAIDLESIAKRIRRQHGTRRWPFKQSAIGLPEEGYMLSLSKRKIMRKTLKRKCRNMSVLSLEYHQHVDSKWEDSVNSIGAKHIYKQLVIHRVSRAKHIHRQHGIHRWPFQQNLATLKGYFLGDKRPVAVICLSIDGKLVSRLQLIQISWLGRFSFRPPALPPGGEIVGPPLALSSSQSTSNRAQLGGQDRSCSTVSHSQNKRTTEPEPEHRKRKINFTIEDLRPHVGLKCADAAKKFQISQSTFKRCCRELGIKQWPDLPIGEVWKPPDPPERNTGQIDMVNEQVVHLPEPIDVLRPPDPRERNTRQTEVENVVVRHVHEPNHLRDYFDSPCRSEENDSMDLQSVLQEVEAIQVIDKSPLSTAYPNLDVPLHPQVVPTQMVSGSTGIPNDQRNLLASQAETHLERCGTGTTCSNPASSQDTSSVMLKVYGLRKEIIRFQFLLTSGIDELKGEVAMRLRLQQDSFDMHYEDDEGDKILIPIDKDLTNYLSSSVNPVIKLWVVPSPTDLCGNCGASLKR